MNIRRKYLAMACSVVAVFACLTACKPKLNPEEVTVTSQTPVNEAAVSGEPSISQATTTIPSPSPSPTEEPTPQITPAPVKPDARKGKQGYIYIPNTNVEYTVVLGEDNEYYLDRDENGNRNYHGAIFMDFRNASGNQRRNIILYGHNMKDNTMFTTLHRFEKEEFFKENDTIEFEMFGVKYNYEIVYSGMVDYRKYNHIHTSFSSEEVFLNYFAEGAENAQFVREGYKPEPGDQMLTLSTCVSHSIKDYNKKRMVVVARMAGVIGEGEHSEAPEEYTHEIASEVFASRVEYATAMMQMDSGSDQETNIDVEMAPPGD